MVVSQDIAEEVFSTFIWTSSESFIKACFLTCLSGVAGAQNRARDDVFEDEEEAVVGQCLYVGDDLDGSDY